MPQVYIGDDVVNAIAGVVVTVGLANGTDDTAAINAVLATAPKVVRGVPGQNYQISAPLVIRSGTTLDMTGCTVTLKAGSNCNMLQNYQVVANNGRDSAITVIGGRWDRGANMGETVNLHFLRFRRVDGLVVRDLTGTGTEGKGVINAGDVTRVAVHGITLDGIRGDAVHFNGPAQHISVRNISGTSCIDDVVAFTPRDWTGYDDTFGDITDVLVDGVYAKNCQAAVIKISGGTGSKTRRITVRNVYGNTSSWGIAVIDETQNGPCDIDDLTIDGVHILTTSPSSSLIHLSASAVGTIRISNVQDVAGVTSGSVVKVQQAAGSAAVTMGRLVLDGFDITQGQSRNVVDINTGATVADLIVRGSRFALATGNGNVITLAGATSSVGRVIASDLHLTNCRTLLNTSASTPALTLVAHGIYAQSCSRILNLLGVSVDATLSDCVFDAIVAAWAYVSGGTVTIRGGGISRVGTQVGVQRAAAEVVRVINPDWFCDVGLLAKNNGDTCQNTAAGTGVLPGPGVLICDGTTWRQAATAAVKSSTATLVAGTVTISDAQITSTSIIRVTGRTVSGTPGALFVSAKSPGVSFTVSSTNAADTSGFQYDIVNY